MRATNDELEGEVATMDAALRSVRAGLEAKIAHIVKVRGVGAEVGQAGG